MDTMQKLYASMNLFCDFLACLSSGERHSKTMERSKARLEAELRIKRAPMHVHAKRYQERMGSESIIVDIATNYTGSNPDT